MPLPVFLQALAISSTLSSLSASERTTSSFDVEDDEENESSLSSSPERTMATSPQERQLRLFFTPISPPLSRIRGSSY